MNKEDRRTFLKRASAGALGIGALLSGLAASDPVFARLNSRYTRKHIENVMEKIRTATLSAEADLAFLQSLNNLQDLVEKESGAAAIFDLMVEYLSSVKVDVSASDSEGLLGLPLVLSDALVGGYLASLEKLESGALHIDELRRGLFRVESWVKSVEPDFISDYARKIENEIASDQQLVDLFDNGGRPHLEKILVELNTGGGPNAVNEVKVDCYINGQPVSCWVLAAVVAVVIIVVVVK